MPTPPEQVVDAERIPVKAGKFVHPGPFTGHTPHDAAVVVVGASVVNVVVVGSGVGGTVVVPVVVAAVDVVVAAGVVVAVDVDVAVVVVVGKPLQ